VLESGRHAELRREAVARDERRGPVTPHPEDRQDALEPTRSTDAVAEDAVGVRVPSGEHRGERGEGHRNDRRVALEAHAALGERVDVGRDGAAEPVDAEVVPGAYPPRSGGCWTSRRRSAGLPQAPERRPRPRRTRRPETRRGRLREDLRNQR
jgi:hypothetical protein